MTSTALPDPAPSSPVRVRRPPSPDGSRATVTQLGPAIDRRDSVPLASVQGTLALDLTGEPATLPVGPDAAAAPPDLRLVTSGPTDDQELQAWTARFAQATVEAIGGHRPVSQLVRWTSPRVYQDLERRVQILSRATPTPPRLRTVRPQVRSVRVFRPGPASAEVSVHVRHGERSRAIAARLELCPAGWRCVALQLG